MSKISFKDTVDTYAEHWCHQSHHSDCSICFKENRYLKAKKIVDSPYKGVLGKDCLNCGIKSHYSYCDKCQRLAEDYENYKESHE